MAIGFMITVIALAALIGFFSRQALANEQVLQTEKTPIDSKHPDEEPNSNSQAQYESHSHII